MNISRYAKKRAISPVLATVILIAITLVAAVAIATFVFGLFGTSVSGPTLSIISSTVTCSDLTHCQAKVQNTGASAGSITGCGPTAGSGVTFTCTGASVPANSQILFLITPAGGASGQQAEGYFTQQNGPNLVFTVVLP